MKSTILLLGIILLYTHATAQSNNYANASNTHSATISLYNSMESKNTLPVRGMHYDKTPEDYLKKSREQLKTGLILLGTGVLLSGFGLLIATNNNSSFDEAGTAVVLLGLGALSGIASIPVIIVSSANRYKAKLMLSKQQTGWGLPKGQMNMAGLTYSVSLGK